MPLSFVFTENSFRVDRPEEDYGAKNLLRDEFQKDKYRALFRLVFDAKGKNETPSLRFLHPMADSTITDRVIDDGEVSELFGVILPLSHVLCASAESGQNGFRQIENGVYR